METRACATVGLALALLAGGALGAGVTSSSNGPTGSVFGPPAASGTMAGNLAGILVSLEKDYATLYKADHDYHGHRASAMKEIADASKLLGKVLSGDGKAGETQVLSDLQIRSVEMSLVMEGRLVPAGGEHDGIMEHMNRAIEQLRLAIESETDPKAAVPATRTATRPATQPKSVFSEPPVDWIGSNRIELESLARIYGILEKADHDYKGHRASALSAIARASKLLGGNLAGDGKGGEKQAVSDTQLHEAQTLLGQVRASFVGKDPKSVITDLDHAVSELSIALTIK